MSAGAEWLGRRNVLFNAGFTTCSSKLWHGRTSKVEVRRIEIVDVVGHSDGYQSDNLAVLFICIVKSFTPRGVKRAGVRRNSTLVTANSLPHAIPTFIISSSAGAKEEPECFGECADVLTCNNVEEAEVENKFWRQPNPGLGKIMGTSDS